MNLWPKIRALFAKEKLDAEMAAEMQAHLELQIEENLARGMSPDEARYAARRQFGGMEQIKERVRVTSVACRHGLLFWFCKRRLPARWRVFGASKLAAYGSARCPRKTKGHGHAGRMRSAVSFEEFDHDLADRRLKVARDCNRPEDGERNPSSCFPTGGRVIPNRR